MSQQTNLQHRNKMEPRDPMGYDDAALRSQLMLANAKFLELLWQELARRRHVEATD